MIARHTKVVSLMTLLVAGCAQPEQLLAPGDVLASTLSLEQFQAQHGGTGEGPAHSSRRRTAPPAHQGGMLTRARIAELYELHRRGKLTGDAWARTEEAIIASARNGMVPDALDPHGRR